MSPVQTEAIYAGIVLPGLTLACFAAAVLPWIRR